MVRNGRKVVRFWRGARRHPKWDMGKPYGPKRRSPNSSRRMGLRLGGFGGSLAVLVLAFVVVPPIVDAGKGILTPTEGCHVSAIIDGDTVKIFCSNWETYSARILAYDAPELFSPECLSEMVLAVRAKWYLRLRLWSARSVVVRQDSTDRYGRRLIVLLMDGRGVAREMVNAGLARWYDGGPRNSWCDPTGVVNDV